MLMCIVIDFFLNNQPDALINPIFFCYKTLHVSGILSAHHQQFSTVHSALVSFMQVSDDRFQSESGRSILTLFGSGTVENS
jgi:RNase P/RNase MRP subunit POP5